MIRMTTNKNKRSTMLRTKHTRSVSLRNKCARSVGFYLFLCYFSCNCLFVKHCFTVVAVLVPFHTKHRRWRECPVSCEPFSSSLRGAVLGDEATQGFSNDFLDCFAMRRSHCSQ